PLIWFATTECFHILALENIFQRTGSNNTTIHDPIITQENLPWMKRGSRHKRREKIRKKEREKKQRLLFLVVAQEHITCSSDLKKDLKTPKGRVYAKRKMGTRLRVKGIYLNRRRQPENGDLP
nr:hypothetical protein [Tanacetum cinerariifolium]